MSIEWFHNGQWVHGMDSIESRQEKGSKEHGQVDFRIANGYTHG